MQQGRNEGLAHGRRNDLACERAKSVFECKELGTLEVQCPGQAERTTGELSNSTPAINTKRIGQRIPYVLSPVGVENRTLQLPQQIDQHPARRQVGVLKGLAES